MAQSQHVARIALASVLWSTGGLGIKLAPLPGPLVAAGRALVTLLFHVAVFRPDIRRARWDTAVAYAGMILCFVIATKLTTAANAIFLQYTGTAWVLLLAPRVLGERLMAADVVAAVLALIGVGLCGADGLRAGHLDGDALGALSGVFCAGSTLLMRRDAKDTAGDTALASTTLGNLLCAAVGLPLTAVLAPEAFAWLAEPRAWLALLYLGVVQMGVTYVLWVRALRFVTAGVAAVVALLEPALGPLWVWLGTGETPGPLALAGGGLVLAALAGRTLWGMRKSR
jgi:drug/metabolite transporter (DMT)-like permease